MRLLFLLCVCLVTGRVAAQSPEIAPPLAGSSVAASPALPEASAVYEPGIVPVVAADLRPSRGTAKRVAGWIAMGWFANSAVQVSLCLARVSERFGIYSLSRTACTATASVLAGVSLGVALPLLIVGYRQRARHDAWRARHGLSGLGVDVGDLRRGTAASLSYRASF